LDVTRRIERYNRDLFEIAGSTRNSIMHLLESPSDAEIKFRKYIEAKQKGI
jgi:hypothetical protein